MFATNDVGGRVDEPAQCGRKPCSTCWRVQRGVPYQIRAAVYPGSRWCQRQTSVQALALPRPRSVLSIPSSSSQLDGWRAIHDRGLRHVRELSAKYVCVRRGCGHRLNCLRSPWYLRAHPAAKWYGVAVLNKYSVPHMVHLTHILAFLGMFTRGLPTEPVQ